MTTTNQLTISVEGKTLPDQVALPGLVNLRIVGGPSTSTQMSFVNGSLSQSRSWTYVLQPLATGHAEVGVVHVQTHAGEATAPAIPIEVVEGSVKPQQPQRRSMDPFAQDPFAAPPGRGRGAEPRLLVEAKPSRSSVFVGEPILLTYYLYTQVSISGLQFTDAPQYPGFWAEDLEKSQNLAGEAATVDGVSYRRFPVMTKLLFPTRSGRLSIPASSLTVGIQPRSFFDAGGALQRTTRAFTIDVKPIPDEPGFSGAVGRFRATATVDRPALAIGEAATLRFRVEGTGNLKWVDRGPELTVPGAKVFPPQTKSDLKSTPSGIVGSRTWEFVIVPQTAGSLEIPALTFSYFDPAGGRIVRSTTTPLSLRIDAGAPGAADPVPMPRSGTVSRGGPLPLRAQLDLRSRAGGAFSGRVVGIVAAVILVLHGLLWGAGRLGGWMPRAGAPAAAPHNLRGALGELDRVGRGGMSKEAAAGCIEKAIHRVFGSLDGDDSERASVVRSLLDEVHGVRYAPQLGDYSEKVRELAARAAEVVRRWA